MASRRDELNAYTFARKRMVGAFLQPSGGGNDEDAPRPVRAVLPSVVVAAVVVAGFGMWGVIKPAAPLHWDEGKSIIQGKQSTTRYVLLPEGEGANKHMYLHQVLNMSSARLVLTAGAQVQIVADDVLDKYPWRGPTIGIPYAPDKLPKEADAGQAKTWSVCDRPGTDANTQATINQAVFVAADKEAARLADPKLRVGDGQSLFVQAPPEGKVPGSQFLVDGKGVKHAVGTEATADTKPSLATALFGDNARPQQVTDEWLRTLDDGNPITFPVVPDFEAGKSVNSTVGLGKTEDKKVGRLLKFQDDAYYVVGKDRLFQITAFQAELMRLNPALTPLYGNKTPTFGDLTPQDRNNLQNKIDNKTVMTADPVKDWPTEKSPAVNIGAKGSRSVICSSFDGMDNGLIKRSVWADTEYPVQVSAGSATAHVTPGHGLLFRAVDGPGQDSSGSDFLITETGLRYSLPANGDGGKAATGASASASPAPQQQEKKEANESQARLGYKNVAPLPVPQPWARLVPAGPVLDTNVAVQAQNA